MQLVLLVEDEFGISEFLETYLQSEGLRVVCASNGKAALSLLTGERPAVILSDFMMPHMDGAELGLAIRSNPLLRDIPFVMMSGTSMEIVKAKFTDYDAFLPKPFEVGPLMSILLKLIDSGRPSRPSMDEVDKSMRALLRGVNIPDQK